MRFIAVVKSLFFMNKKIIKYEIIQDNGFSLFSGIRLKKLKNINHFFGRYLGASSICLSSVFTLLTVSAVSAATLNYPDSGNGKYQGSVAMLDWAGSALDNGIHDGDSVSFALPGCRTGTLNATFSNISNATNAANYTLSDMQTWSGASMYTAYNGPGTGEAIHSPNGGDVDFRVSWSMVVGGVSVSPDIFVLDAESTNGGGESLGATTNGGNWSLVDSAGGTAYTVSGIGTNTFNITDSENTPRSSPALLSMGATQTDLTINAGGRQAVAFAILLPCDYGDANGYASAVHAYAEEPASPDGLQFVAGQLYIGSSTSTPDSETGQQDSATATGDDADSLGDDEGGISTFPTLTVGQGSYTIPAGNITASGSGTLHSWIDFNSNESFETNEHDSVTVTGGTLSADLVFSGYTAPSATGNSFARFRFTTDTLTSSNAATAASNGEIEDHLITIDVPTPADLSAIKTLDSTGPFTTGLIVEYTIVVSNAASPANTATSIVVTDFPTNQLVLSATGDVTTGCTIDPLPATLTVTNSVICNITTLAAGTSKTIAIKAKVP